MIVCATMVIAQAQTVFVRYARLENIRTPYTNKRISAMIVCQIKHRLQVVVQLVIVIVMLGGQEVGQTYLVPNVPKGNSNLGFITGHAQSVHLVLTWTPKEQLRQLGASIAHRTPCHCPVLRQKKTVFVKWDTKKYRVRVPLVIMGIIKSLRDKGYAIRVEYTSIRRYWPHLRSSFAFVMLDIREETGMGLVVIVKMDNTNPILGASRASIVRLGNIPQKGQITTFVPAMLDRLVTTELECVRHVTLVPIRQVRDQLHVMTVLPENSLQ